MSLATGRAATARTFNLRSRARTWSFWVVLLIAAAVLSSLLLWPASGSDLRLDPANAQPDGMKALAEVLRQEGVSIEVVHSFPQLERVDIPTEPATLVITGAIHVLGIPDFEGLLSRYAHVVSIGDPSAQYERYLTRSEMPGSAPYELEAACPDEIVGQARQLHTETYLAFEPNEGAQLCFPKGGVGAMVHFTLGSGTVVDVIADDQVMTNAGIVYADAAALGLTLMGRHRQLTWLNIDPALANDGTVKGDGGADALDLQPPWFTAMAGLLTWTVLVAMIWRGRRLGRLVVEPLPVVVKAIETTLARGRIYHKTHAMERSLQALQQATVRRLAASLALPATTHVAQISDAAATAANRDPAQVWQILTAPAASEDDLVSRAQSLATLEQEVRLK